MKTKHRSSAHLCMKPMENMMHENSNDTRTQQTTIFSHNVHSCGKYMSLIKGYLKVSL